MNKLTLETVTVHFAQQAPVAVHAAPAGDDFGAMAIVRRRAKVPEGVSFLPVHAIVGQSQIQYWQERGIPVIDIGPLKYKNAGFASAAESIVHRCVEAAKLQPELFHDLPLTPNEQALIEILNENNETGALKRMKRVAFAYYAREVFQIFPQREMEIIERGVELVSAWIDLRDDEGGKSEEALRKGFQYVREQYPNEAKRFEEGYAKGILTIGQLFATYGYYASSGDQQAVDKLAQAVTFWSEMADGIESTEQAAEDMVRSERNISIFTVRPQNKRGQPMDFKIRIAKFEPSAKDEHLARIAAKLVFECLKEIDVLIMKTPSGNINIRYNRDALRRDFDITKASEDLFQVLEQREGHQWYRQAETNVILNGSSMAPAKPTQIKLDDLARYTATYLGRANLRYLAYLKEQGAAR